MFYFILEDFFDCLFNYLLNYLLKSSDLNNDPTSLEHSNNNTDIDTDVDHGDITTELPSTSTQTSSNDSSKNIISHLQVCYMDPILKRVDRYNLTVQRSMKVEDFKKELYNKLNDNGVEHSSDLAIIFMGKVLPDNLEISGCDLGDYSIIHALDSEKVKQKLSRDQNKNSRRLSMTQELKSDCDDNNKQQLSVIAELNQVSSRLTTVEESKPLQVGEGEHDLNENKIMENLVTEGTSNITSTVDSEKNYFFVYCQVCASLRNGKLRVACDSCGQGLILCKQDPQNWSDVMLPCRIASKCFTPNCQGQWARFYFKCIDESQHPSDSSMSECKTSDCVPSTSSISTVNKSVLPLIRIRHNKINAACLACMDTRLPVVLVFGCGHVICLDCFIDYCKTCITERSLSVVDAFGCTINCPFNCDESWLETSHFTLLDAHFYGLYEKISNEEIITQNGGIFCPYPDCDQPYYSDAVLCYCDLIQCQKCHFFWCVRCTFEGQFSPVHCDFEEQIETRNSTIRQTLDTKRQEGDADGAPHEDKNIATTYLRTLIDKFSLLRRIGLGEDQENGGTGSPQRWQDTMSRLKIQEIAKPCPKCRMPTERNGGCMHMVCARKRCSFHWCWLCHVEWNNDCMATHWFG